MPTFLQLSATTWLNLDTVVRIEHGEKSWQVAVVGRSVWVTLSLEEGEVLAHYLYAHAEREGYQQTARRRRELLATSGPEAEGEPHG